MSKINVNEVAKKVADQIKKEDLRWASRGVFPLYVEMALDKVLPFSMERVAVSELIMFYSKERLEDGSN